MIYFLFGQDSYRSRQKLNEIIGEYEKVHKSGLSLDFIDCEENKINMDELKNKIRQASMFKEKKLIVITNLFSDANIKEGFQKLIKDFQESDDIIVIYENKDIKKGDPLYKMLGKIAKTQEFKILEMAQFKNWIKNEFEAKGARIDNQALDIFLSYVGGDLWQAANEIQKLAAFKNNKEITPVDVRLLIKPRIETDIFNTIDAIAEKNKKQALTLLSRHIENGDSPLYLLSMIAYQVRNLLIVKDLLEKNNSYGLIVKKSGLHPYVVKKTYSQCRQFTLPELKKIYQKLFETDFKTKTGKIEPEMALELLVAEI